MSEAVEQRSVPHRDWDTGVPVFPTEKFGGLGVPPNFSVGKRKRKPKSQRSLRRPHLLFPSGGGGPDRSLAEDARPHRLHRGVGATSGGVGRAADVLRWQGVRQAPLPAGAAEAGVRRAGALQSIVPRVSVGRRPPRCLRMETGNSRRLCTDATVGHPTLGCAGFSR